MKTSSWEATEIIEGDDPGGPVFWIADDGHYIGAFNTERDRNRCLTAMRIVDALNELRAEEMSAVHIPNDNPDFGGPACVIEVFGDWVQAGYPADYEHGRTFQGDSLLDCLRMAVEEKRATKEK